MAKSFTQKVGEIVLWGKVAASGTKYLNGHFTIDDVKHYISLFKNEGEGKAVLKGKVTVKELGQYITLAYASAMRNEGKGDHVFYGFINTNTKLAKKENLDFCFKLYKNEVEAGSNKPVYEGDVFLVEDKKEEKDEVFVVVPVEDFAF